MNKEKVRRQSREILGGGASVGAGPCSHIKGFGLLLRGRWEATGGCEPRSDMMWLMFLEIVGAAQLKMHCREGRAEAGIPVGRPGAIFQMIDLGGLGQGRGMEREGHIGYDLMVEPAGFTDILGVSCKNEAGGKYTLFIQKRTLGKCLNPFTDRDA